ncbi:MAG TPA: DUF3501 domain-containing protein [Gammaproteobacteria bacterium]|nr:DUF3501 domain-containing protein [Gammaproteobacteria bacterium]
MKPLKRSDLFSLERYAETRSEFRQKVLVHKKSRQVAIGAHITLYFEDRLTIQYQIQEMLRTERIFEADAIQEELDAYNPLIPNGENLMATMMLEYSDVAERQAALEKLIGVEDKIWLQLGQNAKIFAIADEDLERENEQKTSAVHFLRFPLDDSSIHAFNNHEPLLFGCDHEHMLETVSVESEATYQSLLADLNP